MLSSILRMQTSVSLPHVRMSAVLPIKTSVSLPHMRMSAILAIKTSASLPHVTPSRQRYESPGANPEGLRYQPKTLLRPLIHVPFPDAGDGLVIAEQILSQKVAF